MTKLQEIELNQIIPRLPDPSKIPDNFFNNCEDDLFLCALGFEDRCLTIPDKLSKANNYRCNQAIYFEYSTNKEDSVRNFETLNQSLLKVSKLCIPIECDIENFFETFRNQIAQICLLKENPRILFDISTCSSKLLLTVLKILFDFKIQLKIVYTEAEIYHPLEDDVNTDEKIQKWVSDENLGLAKGIADYTSSRGFPGNNVDGLPNAIIVFASFNPARNENAILKADEFLLANPGKRVIWIIGVPHYNKDNYRVDFLIKCNNISENSPIHRLLTFDYKETLLLLNQIYTEYNFEYHIFISPLGSKIQSIGIALFHQIKPDITINFSQPKEYNASRFSEGTGISWCIDFGNFEDIKNLINSVGFWEMKGYIEYL